MSPDTSIQSTEQNKLSNFEKSVYNTFLVTGKKIKDQPFKIRENFTTFEPEKFIQVRKLGMFFNRFKHIKPVDFFSAPYFVYSKTEYFDLAFYNSRKAIVCYSNYMRNKQLLDPESEESIADCKTILKFIYTFCADNNLTLKDYKAINVVPLFLPHLKDHSINFLTLHALDIDFEIKRYEKDFLDFYFPDFYTFYKQTRNNFISSTRFKTMMRKGLEIIENKLLISKVIYTNI